MEKFNWVICGIYKKFETPKIAYIFKKILVLLSTIRARMKLKKYSKKNNQLRY